MDHWDHKNEVKNERGDRPSIVHSSLLAVTPAATTFSHILHIAYTRPPVHTHTHTHTPPPPSSLTLTQSQLKLKYLKFQYIRELAALRPVPVPFVLITQIKFAMHRFDWTKEHVAGQCGFDVAFIRKVQNTLI